MRTALVIVAMLAAGTARADDVYFDSLTMDHQTPVSTLDFDLGFHVYDEPDNTDFTLIGVTVHGHLVDRRSGLGGYVTLPITYVGIETNLPPTDDSELMLGNIEVGGLLSRPLGRSGALVLHGGIALPTADDDEGLLSALQPLAATQRFGDLAQRTPDVTWLRLGISPMGRSGMLMWRADFGLDLAIDEDDNVDSFSPAFHLGIGGGLDLGTAELLAELVTDFVDDDRANTDDDSASMLTLGARFAANNGKLWPGVALSLPIDFDEALDLQFVVIGSLAVRL